MRGALLAKQLGIGVSTALRIAQEAREGGSENLRQWGFFRTLIHFRLKTPNLRYSVRSACIGEIEAARFAGITAATKEQATRAAPAAASAMGSHDETP
jgi:hypothetical protein